MPSEKSELKKLSDKVLANAVPLKNLRLTDELSASCLGMASIKRSTDLDALQVVKELDVETSSNRASSLLTQVNALNFHSEKFFFLIWSHNLLRPVQFNAHFVHLTTIAAESEGHQRRADDYKE